MFDYIKNPERIEEKSFEIISEVLGPRNRTDLLGKIVKRVIHTTADFDYADLLEFKPGVEEKLLAAFQEGCTLVSDTNMIKAGISKKQAEGLGIRIACFVDSEEAHKISKEKGITRSMAAVDMAASIPGRKVFVVGNAPTALFRIIELYREGALAPEAIVGVPVGFVGAAESKDALWRTDIPSVISRGGKGGSTVGVAIVNAVLREAGARLG